MSASGGWSPSGGRVQTDGALRLPVDGLTPDALRGAVEQAADSAEMAAAARRLRRDFDRMDGFATAAGLVERLAAGRPVLRPRSRSAVRLEASHASV